MKKDEKDLVMGGDPEEDDGDEDAMEKQMQAMLGIGGFGTTKDKKVLGNDVSAIRKEKKTEYRQYMSVSLGRLVGMCMATDFWKQEPHRWIQSSFEPFVSHPQGC